MDDDEPVLAVINPTTGAVLASNIEMQQSDTTTYESPPVIQALADGRFIGVWYKNATSDDTTSMTVQARIFNADGTAGSNEFQVGLWAVDGADGYDVPNLTVEQLAGGEIVVGWVRNGAEAGDDEPVYVVLNVNGSASVGTAYDAAAVTASLEIARYYENTLKVAGNAQAKVAANWIMGELSARLNREDLDIEAAPVNPEQLGGLIARIADQTISNAIAKKVFDALWQGQGKSADEIIEAQGLKQITDTGAIEALVDEVLAANPGNVAEFKAGKEKALNALVGQIMKAAKGKANPQQVNDLLKKKLS